MSNEPGHYTESRTRKFQTNGPIAWSPAFKDAAGASGREGEGIRAALAYAVANRKDFVAWASANPAQWSPAMRATEWKAVKVKEHRAKAKAPKAAKAPKVKAPKAPKVKAPKVPKVKAPKTAKAKGDAEAAPVAA